MKFKRKKEVTENMLGVSKPSKNKDKQTRKIMVVGLVAVLLIAWIYTMGRKANQTVPVVMLSQNVYKNQVITETMLKQYDMLEGEFEKYSVTQKDGTQKRRILLWSEKDKIINSFAAYPLQQDTYAEYRDFIKSRTDNTDNVLYSFPGKTVVPLELTGTDLQSLKSFLQPGDKINVEAVFTQKKTVAEDDGLGGTTRTQMDVVTTEPVFTDLTLADLLNQQGDSILDIMASYNQKTVYEQSQLDTNQSFKDSTKPSTMLVALTPQEQQRLYTYTSKNQIKFKVSLPQRVS